MTNIYKQNNSNRTIGFRNKHSNWQFVSFPLSEGQTSCSLAESDPSENTKTPTDNLNSSAMNLLRSSLSWSARKSYKDSWNLIFIFDKSVTKLPLSVIQIFNFIGVLFDKSYSPSTITSHVSAISYIHKILDPTIAFVVKKNSSKEATTLGSHMIPAYLLQNKFLWKLLMVLINVLTTTSQQGYLKQFFY